MLAFYKKDFSHWSLDNGIHSIDFFLCTNQFSRVYYLHVAHVLGYRYVIYKAAVEFAFNVDDKLITNITCHNQSLRQNRSKLERLFTLRLFVVFFRQVFKFKINYIFIDKPNKALLRNQPLLSVFFKTWRIPRCKL